MEDVERMLDKMLLVEDIIGLRELIEVCTFFLIIQIQI